MVKRAIGIALVLGLLTGGCAPQRVWTSLPAEQTLSRGSLEMGIEPVPRGGGTFTAFQLTLVNRAAEDLRIDWNASAYLYDGRLQGGFVFAGIRPTDVREKKIPPEIVPPGATLTKQIAPFRLIAKAPLKNQSVGRTVEGISGGPLPAGANGVRLALTQNGRNWTETLTVRLEVEEVNP